jgi:hypothetical protein
VEGRAEGARHLILAVFRLAVCDYLGLSYGHDAPERSRRVCSPFAAEAGLFLASSWAAHLADLAGFRSQLVWREAQGMKEAGQARRPAPSGRSAAA